jgi:hypothetical protein
MVHIHVNIEKDEPRLLSAAHIRPMLGALLVGVLVGIVATGNFTLPLPENASSQLGAVGAATTNPNATVDAALQPDTNTVNASDTAIVNSVAEVPLVPLVTPPSQEEVARIVRATIAEKTQAVDRLGSEMLRIKNESVELVAGFNQNCANWNDACAAPYKEALDKNNSSYDRLVQALVSLNQEVATAESSLPR